MKIIQRISNSKLFLDVERTVIIAGLQLNFDARTFDINYRIISTKGEPDVSAFFYQQLPEWHVDNSIKMIVRDENFEPILNRNFIAEKDENGNVLNENERYFTMPAFDYLQKLILESPVKLIDILRGYIMMEDADGRFNF